MSSLPENIEPIVRALAFLKKEKGEDLRNKKYGSSLLLSSLDFLQTQGLRHDIENAYLTYNHTCDPKFWLLHILPS